MASETSPSTTGHRKIRPLRIIRDVVLIFSFSLLGGFVVGFAYAVNHRPTSTVALALCNLLCLVVGFAIAAYHTRRRRWLHLMIVSGGLWIAGLVNLLFGVSIAQWSPSIVFILVAMAVGGGIGGLLREQNG